MTSSILTPILNPPSHDAVIVRPLISTTAREREKILKEVEYNVFAFPAGLVTCDFLSDSGTSAMTDLQWAALIRADESYGRNWGYYCLLDTFRDIFERGNSRQHVFHSILTGMVDSDFYQRKLLLPYEDGFANGGSRQLEHPNFFIVPQGRCAEFLLFSTLRDMIPETSQKPIVISNGFFDTTAAHATSSGFDIHTFTQFIPTKPFIEGSKSTTNPFMGGLDVSAAEPFMDKHPGQVKLILITITNNWAAGQPVSMKNIKDAADLAKRKGVPLFFDACRFAENSWFVQNSETGYANKEIPEIIQEMFSFVDGFTISLKKDGLSNMGGVLCFRDKALFAQQYQGIGHRLKQRQILCYGNDSYGAMSGRDLMAAVAGLYEVTKETYLKNRISQVRSFARKLHASHIPVFLPTGGHAVYLDMDRFFHGCDRELGDFPSVGFTLELLKDYGIRSFEAGPFGWEWDRKPPEERKQVPNLVRFAVPRQVFSDQHIDYTVAAIKDLHNRRHTLPNVEITRGKDMLLRHFSCAMRPVPVDPAVTGTYLSEARRQLSHLSRAIDQDEAMKEQLLEAFELAAGEWGRALIPRATDSEYRVSSDNHSLFKYSVTLDQVTSEAKLQFLIGAEPENSTLTHLQDGAVQLNATIASLEPFELVQDVFLPRTSEGAAAALYSCRMGKTGAEWKIHIKPWASGTTNTLSVTRIAFERLGMTAEWGLVERTMTSTDSVAYISLDLSTVPEDACVEVYIAHKATSASDIARKHEAICPRTSAFEIQRFCEIIAGGSFGPYMTEPLLSCFVFANKARSQPIGTVCFPIESYAGNDSEVQERIEKYMLAKSLPPLYRERYRTIVSAVQRRPLAQKSGLHSWVSLTQSSKGALSNTFYLSPDIPWE
ncbi:beta-eliminating lyase [Xylaria sp. FL1777]|nr:beta-eliminating lyase [Xylaria sp. FL1777]